MALVDYTIKPITPDNIDEVNIMRLNSWLDTYVNDELGITREWILERNKQQMSDEVRARRLQMLLDSSSAGWVAMDKSGKVIGITTPFVDEAGEQHVGSLYVEKSWHGKGVGAALMKKAIGWFDDSKPILCGVVTYNEQAKAFYRKWGFKEIPGSETLFDNKIPEVMMVREPTQ